MNSERNLRATCYTHLYFIFINIKGWEGLYSAKGTRERMNLSSILFKLIWLVILLSIFNFYFGDRIVSNLHLFLFSTFYLFLSIWICKKQALMNELKGRWKENTKEKRINFLHVQKFIFKSIFYQVFSSKLIRKPPPPPKKKLIFYTVSSDLNLGSLIWYIRCYKRFQSITKTLYGLAMNIYHPFLCIPFLWKVRTKSLSSNSLYLKKIFKKI